ncbi:MAG: hypothetical protein IJ859_09340 [Synergistaceae bacterium]|nr:hypothetical protein [Synergistaceae bacterium]
MSKINKKFNNSCLRLSFWDGLTRQFEGFEKLLKPPDVLTHEDRIALKNIYDLVYQGYKSAKQCKELHLSKLSDLRKEQNNE